MNMREKGRERDTGRNGSIRDLLFLVFHSMVDVAYLHALTVGGRPVELFFMERIVKERE